jgi:hypothetical protein
VHDLNVETFLGKVLGLERDCGMLDMKGMPAGITDSQFQTCSLVVKRNAIRKLNRQADSSSAR